MTTKHIYCSSHTVSDEIIHRSKFIQQNANQQTAKEPDCFERFV